MTKKPMKKTVLSRIKATGGGNISKAESAMRKKAKLGGGSISKKEAAMKKPAVKKPKATPKKKPISVYNMKKNMTLKEMETIENEVRVKRNKFNNSYIREGKLKKKMK